MVAHAAVVLAVKHGKRRKADPAAPCCAVRHPVMQLRAWWNIMTVVVVVVVA